MSLVLSPGPAAYEVKSTIGHAPKFTIPGRHDSKDKDAGPGPGAYQTGVEAIGSPKCGSPRHTIATRNLNLKPAVVTPGPGGYDLKPLVGSSNTKITIAQRLNYGADNAPGMKVPGPGQYSTQVELGKDRPAYTIAHRHKDPTGALAIPGPGAYKPDPVPNKYRAISIGRGLREITHKAEVRPGPGSYSARSFIGSKDGAPRYTISLKTNIEGKTMQTPGAGTYELKSTVGINAPKITISARHDMKDARNDGPGPGAYNDAIAAVKTRNPMFSIRSTIVSASNWQSKLSDSSSLHFIFG